MTLLRLTPAVATHVGMRRRHNEDAVGYRYPEALDMLQKSGALFIVADGVGGLSAGERASDMAVAQLIKRYYAADTSISPEERLAIAFQQVNTAIYRQLHNPQKPAATTLVAAAVIGDALAAASIGDSLIFHLRGDQLRQLNEVDVLRDASSEEDGALTKAIGYRETLDVQTISGSLQAGDVLILCSDGLTRYVDVTQLVRLARLSDPRDSVRRMINAANQRGGADNISVIVVQVGDALAEEAIASHVQKLVVPVAIDSQPAMTPDVPTKPTTSIPLSRPQVVVPETLPVTESPLPKAATQPPLPKDRPPAASRRNPLVIIAVVVLAIGALVFFGALFALTQGRGLPTPTTAAPTQPAATNLTAEIISTAESQQPTADNDRIEVGDSVTLTDTIVTLANVGESVGSFPTVPDKPYRVEEIFQDSEGQIWYRLLDEDSNQSGWIAASAVSSGD